MIGKITSGKNFRNLLNYLHKEDAEIIDSNMLGKTPQELDLQFSYIRNLKPEKEKPVFHASLSLAPNENLSNDEWREITETYLEKMGYGDSQYVCYRHNDTEHPHIHIVANRINLHRKIVRDSFEFLKSQKILRGLEKEYGLVQVPSSWEKLSKSQTTGEKQLLEKNGEKSVRLDFQNTINEVLLTGNNFTMPEFIKELKKVGINPLVKFTRNQKVKGISYEKNGIAFAGNKIGRGFTFPGLQKHHNISYDAGMNNEIIEACNKDLIYNLDTQNRSSSKNDVKDNDDSTFDASMELSPEEMNVEDKSVNLDSRNNKFSLKTEEIYKNGKKYLRIKNANFKLNGKKQNTNTSAFSFNEEKKRKLERKKSQKKVKKQIEL